MKTTRRQFMVGAGVLAVAPAIALPKPPELHGVYFTDKGIYGFTHGHLDMALDEIGYYFSGSLTAGSLRITGDRINTGVITSNSWRAEQ